jgi:branched-chain amino acid transport system ATP-binding protein
LESNNKTEPMMLNVEGLTAAYGEIVAFRDVNLFVGPGEMVTLIGANGAGKTSLLRTISGVLKPCKGKVQFKEREIHHLPVHEIVQLGIAWVQEGRGTFKRITVEENLRVGAYHRKKKAMLADMEAIYMRFPILKERCNQVAGTLSGGQQQMLAIARALMSRPRLILLDEPSLGVAPIIVNEIYEIIKGLQRDGITVLLVEQNAALALKTAQRAYVMESGRIVMQGLSKDLADNPCVQQAYLGGHSKPANY